jgi:TolB protein
VDQPGAGSDPQASDKRAVNRAQRFRAFLLLVLVGVAALGFLGLRLGLPERSPALDPTLAALATGLQNTVSPSATMTNPPPSATFTPAPTRSAVLGTVVYAARSNGYTHLWALVPGDPRPAQLSRGEWDDRDPAVSPDGAQVAFASHRDGNWDLYLLDLRSLAVRRLTETPGYEGHPTWSPDGRWIAYEALTGSDFDIWILALDASQPPLRLAHPGQDTSPAWDPQGRRIAFVSSAEGISDLFMANLDDPADRFVSLTGHSDMVVQDPAFSPDGSRLAYGTRDAIDGPGFIQVIGLDDPARPSVRLGPGTSPAWSPDGGLILGILASPTGSAVVAYAPGGEAAIPFGLSIEGPVSSLAWTSAGLPGEAYAAGLDPSGEASVATKAETPSASDRPELASLPGIAAPRALMVGDAASAFEALRTRVTKDSGWDFLSVLDNAFVGLNDPLPPGFAFEDWLYTGRAFAFAQAAYTAGWVEVVREDYRGETYWRVFVRANRQDGSQGEPLRSRPWDFSVRYTGDPAAYDAGGGLRAATPSGYYVDFTQLAADQGFRRLPAMANWRTFFPGARFSEFARTAGLAWMDAMLQIYPASAIVTPTPFRTPTPTPTLTLMPTATPWWWGWRTPTPSRTPTALPTPTP